MSEEKPQARTHFGFESVDWDEKQPRVRGVFERVAARYDLMNDAMSGGLHRVWKNSFVSGLRLAEGAKVLDVAGGTGDIAFRIRKRYPSSQVTLMDINARMLGEGMKRAMDRNLLAGIEWVCGNAEALPFPDSSFHAYTIAFGIRNVTDIPKALAEAHRVLKPGGVFACLEFAPPEGNPIQPVYDAYSFQLIPRMGKVLTGDGEPYRYLVESIRRFPPQQEFARMIEAAGFFRPSWRNVTLGVAAIHTARKL